jgi:hypothetical protein
VQKDRSDGLFDGMRFLVQAPNSQYRQPNSADDGLFAEAKALNSLGKAAVQQTEFCLTVFSAANRSISARNGGDLADGHGA